MSIVGNMAGSYSQLGKTFVIVDENNNELTGVVVSQEQIFTATDNDVREGSVYASDSGVSTGTKVIPAYRTSAGCILVQPNGNFSITNLSQNNNFDYTKLQCIITLFDTNISSSVLAEKVIIDDAVYNVGSNAKISDVVKNSENKSIDLNITNDSENYYLIRFFTYKEEF